MAEGDQGEDERRRQFHHVIDVAPTVLEIAGLPAPRTVSGAAQRPMEGTSFAYTSPEARAKSRHGTQYFEIAGNRAIYHDGWFARTIHRAPWEQQPRASLDRDKWELFDRSTDFSLASCSHYGYQAVYKHGAFKGSFMTAWRILRCNPFNPGGYDPVP